jgi:hypothetical protein
MDMYICLEIRFRFSVLREQSMKSHPQRFSIKTIAWLFTVGLCISSCTTVVYAQGGHHTMTTPGGGKISYGQIDGQTTEAGAMGAVLRTLHDQTGDRPQVGKLFQIHGSQSVGAFLSVSKAKIGGGQIAGLLIATKVTTDHVEVALVTDDAAKFPKTLAPMMKTLFSVWHPLAGTQSDGSRPGGTAGQSAGPSTPAAPLHPYVLPDNSASVSLPSGWNVVPQMSGMGTIVASGPGEVTAELGIAFLAMDTNNPAVQRTLQQLRMGQLRGTSYATAAYVPYGADLTKTFVYLLQDQRKKANLSPATYNFTSAVPTGGNNVRCVRLAGTADFQDGKGQKEMNAVFCAKPPDPYSGSWLSSAYMTTAPMAIAPKIHATLIAVMQSFNENTNVINAQAIAIAKPAIDAIHAYGDMVINRARDSEKAFEIRNSSVYKQWDSNDKRSQEFENSQLGYSVISDNTNSYHGTFWNEDADALVKSHPERFEYVAAPNYWKGVDY